MCFFLLDAKENPKTYGRIFSGKIPGQNLTILPGICWTSILILHMFSPYVCRLNEKFFVLEQHPGRLMNINEAVDVAVGFILK